jgi:hypothetical protein
MKGRLLGLLEQKIHYQKYVSAPGPQMQLGTPPRAGRKMAAMFNVKTKFYYYTDLYRYWYERCSTNEKIKQLN